MSGEKVLIIDDDMDTRSLMEKVLSHGGYQVVLAASGKEGLEAFEKEEIDIVLIDFSLPDMEGVDVATILREKKGADFPLLTLTANTKEVIQMKYPKAIEVFTDFCIKPFSFPDLLALLKKYSS